MMILAVAVGVAITLLTGLIENTPNMLVGAVHYGYPLAWLVRMIVAPEYNPWAVRPMGLVIDLVVWSAVIFVILYAATLSRKKAQ